MIHDMPENGSVIVYNKAFEATRNKEIGELCPDLKNEMERINANMVDLMIPFKNRDYYKEDMYGSYSIKYVLPSLFPNDPSLDYHNLDQIHNGSEAMSTFADLENMSKEEQKETRQNLLKYCELDTYAMVKIWDKLKEVNKDSKTKTLKK